MSALPVTLPCEPPSSHNRSDLAEVTQQRDVARVERDNWKANCLDRSKVKLQAEIEAAHAACDGPVSREGTDGPRPLAERVSVLRKMLSEARYEIPEFDAIPQDDDDGQSVFVGIFCGAAGAVIGAVIGALLACGFLALR